MSISHWGVFAGYWNYLTWVPQDFDEWLENLVISYDQPAET